MITILIVCKIFFYDLLDVLNIVIKWIELGFTFYINFNEIFFYFIDNFS